MNYKLINDWYEIFHNEGDSKQIPWRPCEEWCEVTLGVERVNWNMRNVEYEFTLDPEDASKHLWTTKTPLTWMFKYEKDAQLFILRWL